MGDVVKVYKVKDLKTGLYRTAGGGWSKAGKTWNNLGHLKSSLGTQGYFRPGSSSVVSSDIVIIEIVVQETIGNTTPLVDYISQQRRYNELHVQYGSSFSDLITRIEKDGQQDDWQWLLIIPLTYGKSAIWEQHVLAEIKNLKLKMGTDYRKANSRGLALAFKSKQHAMQMRLRLDSDIKVVSLDIKNFVETNLDEEQSSVV